MWAFLLGATVMAAFLVAIGVTRNRAFSVRTWTAIWTSASLGFAAVLVAAFVTANPLGIEVALGAATGYAFSVGMHTLHHYVELRAEGGPKTVGPQAERRRIRRRVPLLLALLVFHAWLAVRMALAGDIALALLLTVPVSIFAVRIVTYGLRYRVIRRAGQPA